MRTTITAGVHLNDLKDIGLVIRPVECSGGHAIDIGGMLALTVYLRLEQLEEIGNKLIEYACDVRLGLPLHKFGYFPELHAQPEPEAVETHDDSSLEIAL